MFQHRRLWAFGCLCDRHFGFRQKEKRKKKKGRKERKRERKWKVRKVRSERSEKGGVGVFMVIKEQRETGFLSVWVGLSLGSILILTTDHLVFFFFLWEK